jgi:filamentous hemagglutinin
MNKQAYRVIFNRNRGMLIAVAENVPSQGKGSQSGSSSTVTRSPLMCFAQLAVVVAALFGGVTMVQAQIVANPTAAPNMRPTVGVTASGIPLIQIAQPNSAGLSHNQYNSFNVGAQGAVLNNSQVVTGTQLAGQVQGNPNLSGGSANIILNEVVGGSRSQLNGYLEVAGQKAQVIISNENGITCSGCGWINTSRGVLTTGAPVFGGDGSLQAFRVTRGDIQINGLNAANTDQTDLISRSVAVNGQLWANQLNVVTGVNQVNFADLGVQTIQGDNNKPTVAIDVASLGGMYANKIRLVGTEAGVGVRSLGNIASQAGDLNLDSQGQITLTGHTSATGQVTIHSHDGVVNSGTVYGQQAVLVSSDNQITNTGTVAGQADVTLFAGSIASTGVLGAGVDANSQATQSGNLNLVAAGNLSATGQNLAGANVAMNGASLDISHARTNAAGNVALTARAGDINHTGGNLQAGGGASLNASGAVINDSAVINAAQLSSTSASMSNHGGTLNQSGSGTTSLTTSGLLDNSAGVITTAAQNATLQAGSLSNDAGQLSHTGTGTLAINAGALSNVAGNVATGGQLAVTAASVSNQRGQMIAAAAENFNVTGNVANNQGILQSGTGMTVQAGAIDNSAGRITSLDASGLTLSTSGQLTNTTGTTASGAAGGVIGSNGNVVIGAANVVNSGQITGSGNLTTNVNGTLDNSSGHLAAGQTLQANAATVKNSNGVIDGASVALTAPQLDNSHGAITGNQLTIHSTNLSNQAGQLAQFGTGVTTIAVAGTLDNSNGGVIQTNSTDLALTPQTLNNQGGSIAHAGAGTLTINTGSGGVNNQNGSIATNGQLAVTAGSVNNQAGKLTANAGESLTVTGALNNAQGTIQAAKALQLSAGSVDNTAGRITSLDASGMSLSTTGQLTNAAGGVIGGNGSVSVAAANATNGGSITATNNLTTNVGGMLDNSGGRLAAGQALQANAAALKNNAGAIDAANVGLTIAQLDNSHGKVSADQLTIHSTNLINEAGQLAQFGTGANVIDVAATLDNSAGGLIQTNSTDLTLTPHTLNNSGGTIAHAGTGTLTVNTGSGAIANQAGSIATNGQLALTAGSVNNQAGKLTANVGETLNVAGALNNAQGTIQAANALQVSAGSIDNSAGHMASLDASGLALTSAGQLTNGSGGVIGGNGNVAVTALNATNAGSITASHDLATNVSGTLDNSGGRLAAGHALQANAGTLINNAGVIDASTVALTIPQLNNTKGKITADQLTIHSTNITNQAGQIAQFGTGTNVIAVANALDNSNGGVIQTNSADLTLTPQTLNNAGGTIALSGTGTLTVTAGSGVLQNQQGSIGGNGATNVSALSINNKGGSLFGQKATTIATTQGDINNSVGGYLGGSQLTVNAAGNVDNTAGKIEGTQSGLTLNANSLSNAAGTVQSLGGAPLSITAAQGISNGVANGVGGFIGSSGAVDINAGPVDNTGGTLYAKDALTLQANGQLTNSYGVIQSGSNLSATASGAVVNANGRIEGNGSTATMTVSGSSLDNTSGRIANSGTGLTSINGGSQITNTNAANTPNMGTIGGNGDMDLTSTNLDNSSNGQVIAAGNLRLNQGGTVNNNAGKLFAGKNLQLNQPGAVLTNVGGVVSATGNINVAAASVDNTFGMIATTAGAGGDIALSTAGNFNNAAGTVASDHNLTLTAPTLTGNGKVLAQQDENISLQGDYANTATSNQLAANRDLTLSITGNLTNTGNLEAVRNLTLNAASVDNQSTGLINAGNGETVIHASNAITNTGRIYGNDIALGAQSLTNDVDTSNNQAGVIASRNTLQIGAQQIINREHALIQSLGDMALGGALDANNNVTGSAASILNSSATIDSGGALTLQTASLTNQNNHFSTTQQADPTQTTHVTEYNPWYDPTIWYTPNQVTWGDSGDGGVVLIDPMGGRYEKFSKKDYTQEVSKTVVTNSDPGKISSAGNMTLSGNVTNDKSTIIAGGTLGGTTGSINNIGATGTTDTVQHMTAGENYYHYVDGHPHQNHYDYVNNGAAFDNVLPSTPLALQVWTVQQNTQPVTGPNQAVGNGVGGSAVPTVGGLLLGANQSGLSVGAGSGKSVGTVAGGVGATGVGGNVQAVGSASGSVGGGTDSGGTAQAVGSASGSGGKVTTTTGSHQTLGTPTAPLPNLVLPNNQLFTVLTQPNQPYLIQTDPKFTNYGNFISSNYMLGLLGLNPAVAEKRLGDGFYEQKLVTDQVAQLTGKRFLGDYANNEDEYKALMESGVASAKQFQLTPGIALTDAQMASLTSDIVWMVNQDVTLPDGSHTQVLAPVVYLTRADAGDLSPTGALISGKNIDLTINGTLKNGGTLQASNNMIIQATDIANTGDIRSTGKDGTVLLVAQNDVLNNGGSISGHRVGVLAGRDVTIGTDAISATGVQGTNTVLGRVASVTADQLSIQAGRDLNLVAAAVNTTGDATLSAGRDLNLKAVDTQSSYNVAYNSDNHLYLNQTQVNGTAINAGGKLALMAGQDLNAVAATANAGGQLTAVAGRDVNIGTAQQETTADRAIHTTSSGMFSSSSSRSQQNLHNTDVIGSSFTGDGIAIQSGRDTTVQGSQVIAKSDLNINAGRDLNIVSAQQTSQQSFSAEEKKSGFSGSVLTGVSFGNSAQDQHQNGTSVNQIGSDISGANVHTSSGRDTTITASAITADKDIGINAGRDINVLAAANTQTSQSDSHSSGTSIGIMGGANFRFTNYSQTSAEQNSSGNGVTQSTSLISANGGNLSMQAGLDKQYKGTGQGNVTTQGAELIAKDKLSIGGNAVDLQAIKDSSDSQFHAETHSVTLGSSLTGAIGGALTTIGDMATESQKTSNDRLKGALALKAGYDAYKIAGALPGAANAVQNSVGATQDGLVGKDNPANAGAGAGFGVSINLGTSQSKQDSKNSATQARGTTAQASSIDITAREGDINMEGAKLQAQDISLDAAKNINLRAAKSTADLQSSNSGSSAGIGATLGSNGQQTGLSFQIGASTSKGHANGTETTYDNTQISATNQLTVKSGGDLNMKGAQLAGNKVTADVGGDLNIWTLQNVSNFDSKQESGGFSLSICVPPICVGQYVSGSVSYAKQSVDHNYQSAVGQSGIVAGSDGFDIKVKGNTDLQGAAITSTATPDKNSLQTGSLTYSDLTNTQHTDSQSVSVSASTSSLANNAFTNVLGNLNGSIGMPKNGDQTSSTNSVISPANVTIIGTGDGAKDAQSQANATTLTSRDAATANQSLANTLTLQQAQDLQAQQQKAQENQRAAGLVGAALSGMVGDMAQGKWPDGSPEKIALHGIVGLIEAKIGGGSAAAGAIAGMTHEAMVPIMSDYLVSQGYKPGSQAFNDMMNLGATLVGAASGMLAGGGTQGAMTGANAALIADQNNRQLHEDERIWAKGNAAKYQQYLKDKTGENISPEEAYQRLLSAGYAGVDDAALKSGKSDETAKQFIVQNKPLSLFQATAAERANPFLGGNVDGSWTPEQQARYGAKNPTAWADDRVAVANKYVGKSCDDYACIAKVNSIVNAVDALEQKKMLYQDNPVQLQQITAQQSTLLGSMSARDVDQAKLAEADKGTVLELLGLAAVPQLAENLTVTLAKLFGSKTIATAGEAAAQKTATQLNNFYRDGASPDIIQQTFNQGALSSTHNASASEVVLGKYVAGSSTSYEAVAQARGSTYFSMSDWGAVEGQLGNDQMWNINKAFLDQQMAQGKSFLFTGNPSAANAGYFTKLEFSHLSENGYYLVTDGGFYRAIKK